MKLKTVSVDTEAFHMLRKEKRPRESYGDVVRRVFTAHADENYDPSEHIDALFAEFGGKGVLTPDGRKHLLARQQNLAKSPRPVRAV